MCIYHIVITSYSIHYTKLYETRLLSITKASNHAMYMLLLAVFKYSLYRYTQREDIVVGMPAFKGAQQGSTENGKALSQGELNESTSEYTLNDIMLLRNSIDENNSFKELLLAVKKSVEEADEHSNYPISSYNFV